MSVLLVLLVASHWELAPQWLRAVLTGVTTGGQKRSQKGRHELWFQALEASVGQRLQYHHIPQEANATDANTSS